MGGRAAGLVIASDQTSARAYAARLRALTGEPPTVVLSDEPGASARIEAFRDGAAGSVHVGSEHFKAAIRELPEFLAATPEIVNVEVPGTEWSQLAEMALPA